MGQLGRKLQLIVLTATMHGCDRFSFREKNVQTPESKDRSFPEVVWDPQLSSQLTHLKSVQFNFYQRITHSFFSALPVYNVFFCLRITYKPNIAIVQDRKNRHCSPTAKQGNWLGDWTERTWFQLSIFFTTHGTPPESRAFYNLEN